MHIIICSSFKPKVMPNILETSPLEPFSVHSFGIHYSASQAACILLTVFHREMSRKHLELTASFCLLSVFKKPRHSD